MKKYLAILACGVIAFTLFIKKQPDDYVDGTIVGAKFSPSQVIQIEVDSNKRYVFEVENENIIENLEGNYGKPVRVYFTKKTLTHDDNEYIVVGIEYK